MPKKTAFIKGPFKKKTITRSINRARRALVNEKTAGGGYYWCDVFSVYCVHSGGKGMADALVCGTCENFGTGKCVSTEVWRRACGDYLKDRVLCIGGTSAIQTVCLLGAADECAMETSDGER